MVPRAWESGFLLVAYAMMSAAMASRWPGRAGGSVQAVRAVLDRQVADWNKGDLDGFLAGYWNSPKVVFQSGGQRLDGWVAMRDRYRRRYQAEGRAMGRLAFSGLDVEPLGPEAVLAHGRWQLTMPDGTTPGGLFTVIFRKLPRGLEDRARPYVRRRGEAGGERREEGRVREMRVRSHRPSRRRSAEREPTRRPGLLGVRTMAASTRPARNQPAACSMASAATKRVGKAIPVPVRARESPRTRGRPAASRTRRASSNRPRPGPGPAAMPPGAPRR